MNSTVAVPLRAVAVALSVGLLSAGAAMAQVGTAPAAQERYDRQIAQCNSPGRPAPQREACVRAAGRMLDRANGGVPPEPVPQPSADGRAIVMTPPGAPPPPSASDYVTSPDGRAVIAVPPPGDRIVRP